MTSLTRINRKPRAAARRTARQGRFALAAAATLCALLVVPGSALALEQKLTAADGAAGDRLGAAVDVDGDTAVVGAPNHAGGGAVYVYTRNGDSWTQTGKLIASDGAFGDVLGLSVAIDGDTIVAGARSDDAVRGAVYTFARTGAAVRRETAKLTASDGAPQDGLGWSVAIDGDTIVAGAPGKNVFDSEAFEIPEAGAVYTFSRTGPFTRTQTARLTASNASSDDQLGLSVAIDGDTIVAGAPNDDHNLAATPRRGSVFTFARSGPAVRNQLARLTSSDGAANDELGRSVAIEGDTIVAGAHGDDAYEGAAYLFASTGPAARTQTGKLLAADGAANAFLGYSVDIAGATVVAGAPGENNASGAVYTYDRAGAAVRTQTGKLVASDGVGEEFGWRVAVSGDAIIAGELNDDVGANVDQGSATILYQPAGLAGQGPPLGAGPAQGTVPGQGSQPGGPSLRGTPPFPAKLAVLRARVLRGSRRLDVMAPITTRASGRVNVSFLAAGQTTTFTAPIDTRRGRVRISRVISARQARAGSGILTLSYPGDADTQPQVVRLRAAPRPADLRAGRPTITNGRLRASGRIARGARGVVRVQLLFEPAGQPTVEMQFNARISNGRYTLDHALPNPVLLQINRRRGVVHSYTLFTGHQPAAMRGEMASHQVLPAR